MGKKLITVKNVIQFENGIVHFYIYKNWEHVKKWDTKDERETTWLTHMSQRFTQIYAMSGWQRQPTRRWCHWFGEQFSFFLWILFVPFWYIAWSYTHTGHHLYSLLINKSLKNVHFAFSFVNFQLVWFNGWTLSHNAIQLYI